MQGVAGQGIHMTKPKFSIKTEVLGEGGGAKTEAETVAAPPPLFCLLFAVQWMLIL